MKYFLALNANRDIAGIGFDLIGVVAGTVMGIYATEDAGEIAALEAQSERGVSALTEDEYQRKKKVTTKGFSEPLRLVPPALAVPIKAGGVLLDAARPSSLPTETTPEDALKVASVALPSERKRAYAKKSGN